MLMFKSKLASVLIPISLSAVTRLAFARLDVDSYAIWAADSAISRSQGNGLTTAGIPTANYPDGEFHTGLMRLYEITGNQTYFDYILAAADNIVADNGTIIATDYVFSQFSLDPIRLGPTFVYLYEKTGQEKFKTAADTYRLQLDEHPRTAQGQFWHKLIYPNQGWLDGIYMGELFYEQYTAAFQPSNASAWDDIHLQFHLMFNNTVQNATAPNTTQLLYHGYDYSHTAIWASPDRGHSPEVWDRALGWYFMALVDVLSDTSALVTPSVPADPSATIAPAALASIAALRSSLLAILRQLAPRLRDAADPTTGAWWLVLTEPGRAGNYFESSGDAMFVYALLKAVRLGYVDDADGSIVAAAKKGYEYIIDNFVVDNGDGTMGWTGTVVVGSLDTTGDFEYYISQPTDLNDLKGLAAFVLASLEYELL
ncbi:hypothetical protein H0H92_009463 [Tricholoma furcatifolium]|nr:hypothetical protein H0H92_009463 [Tricholoma furcatifolium]